MVKALYFAHKNGEKVAVGGDAALDRLLMNGYEILRIKGDQVDVIATPDEGWLIERPVIQRRVTGKTGEV